ncbi:NHLP bacteriocin system secretion protein [Bosea sp. NPDC003192]|uniref:NHLP bacteriocin system secretion protein n=1 Tax=Bosea sp. NPDC003192 TaxID=3390551 RepID=UPI003D0165A9
MHARTDKTADDRQERRASPAFGDPERLNEAIHLTSRSTWILLAGLGLCVLGIVCWSLLGRLDFHAQGQGIILLRGSEVANVVAQAGGTVAQIHAPAGTKVKAGDLLVTVTLDEIAERRDAARQGRDAQQAEFNRYKQSSDADIQRRQADLQQRLTSLQSDLAQANKNRDMLQSLYDDYTKQLQQGLTTRQQVQAAFDRLDAVEQSIRQMTDSVASAQTSQVEFENGVARNLANLSLQTIDAESRLKDLDIQFGIGATIRSPVDGTVSEITTQANQTVVAGDKLVVVESGTSTHRLVTHAYLPIDQGKRVSVGMPALVSPTSIDDRLYGAIRGHVTRVSTLPMSQAGLQAVIGDPTLVATMMQAGAPIEIEITFDPAPQGAGDALQWTSAARPPTPVTPGTTVASRIVVDQVRPASLILPLVRTWTQP